MRFYRPTFAEIDLGLFHHSAVFIGDKYKILSSAPDDSAYRVYKNHGRVVSEKIGPTNELLPVAELYRR